MAAVVAVYMYNIEAPNVSANDAGGSSPGTDLDTLAGPCQSTTYQKRARSKFFSLPLATRLAEYAKSVESPLEKSYRNTIYCSTTIAQEDGTLTTRYCGNRWCLVCNRIRTARAVEAYRPVLETWAEPYMVTLTIRNVEGADLSAALEEMRSGFASCLRAIRRTHDLPVVALRKLECTYNFRENTYHPHYHAIVDGKEQAELLRSIWLRRFSGRAELAGQDVRLCGEGSLVELFKYFTKLTARTKDAARRMIPEEALDTIFRAMRGRRVWQSCGFTLPEEVEASIEGETIEVKGSPEFKREGEQVSWQWDQELSDWVDMETGELLSEYVPTDRFRALVESISGSQRTVGEESLPGG